MKKGRGKARALEVVCAQILRWKEGVEWFWGTGRVKGDTVEAVGADQVGHFVFSAGFFALSFKGHLVILLAHIPIVSGFSTLKTIPQLVFWKLHCCEFVSLPRSKL